jgi:periplasmic divalent cation tolerance protein
MSENDKPVLIYSTYPSLETAEAAGGVLVDQGLAACVNILPGMVSIYTWEGARHREQEVVMIIKTRAGLAEAVVAAARRSHPYTNPALLVLPVEGGSADFCSWILAQTSGAKEGGR